MMSGYKIECFVVHVLMPLLAQCCSALVCAQPVDADKENGALFIRYFAPKEYKYFPQNWAGLQDQRGVMIFANGDGILKYDGVAWEFHSLPHLPVVRSLAMDEEGKVYTGAFDELGYLGADSLGNHRYVSLLRHLPENLRKVGNIYKTYALKQHVVFQAENGLHLWKDGAFQTIQWQEDRGYRMSFLENDTVYVHQNSLGLAWLNDGKLELVKGGDFFKEKQLRNVLPFDSKRKLIVTTRDGMYLYSEEEIVPFATEVDDFLKESLVYSSIALPDGSYAVGTLTGGGFVITRSGKVKFIFNKSCGLGDNAIYNFCLDNQGALWATLSNGIARIELHTPITHFFEGSGLQGAVNAIARFNGDLYVGSSQGLFKLRPTALPDAPAGFEKVAEITSGVWGMISHDNALFINSDYGAYILKDKKLQPLNSYAANLFCASKKNPDLIFCGLVDGVSVLRKKDGKWTDGGRVSGIVAETAMLKETQTGDLWVSSFSEGVFLLTFLNNNYLAPQVKNFGANDGLEIGYTTIHEIGGQHYFFVKRNELRDVIYTFDGERSKFLEHHSFGNDIGFDSLSVYPVSDESDGAFWVQKSGGSDKFKVSQKAGGGLDLQRISFSRLSEYKFRVLWEEGDIAWWGGHDRLIRMRTSRSGNPDGHPFHVLINKISLTGDSVIFLGTNAPLQGLHVPFDLNSLRFDYASTSYDKAEENRYQFLLEGFDDSWSSWSGETYATYTKIPEGSYIFKVRSENIYGETSEIASYSFSVMPPWYRSWWTYPFYITAVVLVFAGALRWRLGRIKKEKEKLEEIVEERTQEVKRQAEQLEQQASRLLELDQVKSRFFANISHEFRTPITLILGLLEEQLEKKKTEKEVLDLSIMHRSAERLQNLINQLLDLSKLEAGELKLKVGRGDVNWFLKSIAAGFASYAIQQNIHYQVVISDEKVEAYYDPDKLEKMVTNLLSNAFKFTPQGGTVKVRAHVENDAITIAVEDTGAGISPDVIEKIFERFYQVDTSSTRLQEGAGIGLALTKELVDLHKGKIEVESQPGEGSIFRLVLPIAKLFYREEELALEAGDETYSPVSHLIEKNVESEEYLHSENIGQEEQPILLVVEDNKDLRKFIAGHLKGFKVLEAVNGAEGLKKARKSVPDLVISDIMMPEMDGVELCAKLKEDEATSHIPVILLTAKADIESRLEGLSTGADDYITKPFHAAELRVRVKNLIEQRERLKARFSQLVVLKPRDITITSKDEVFLKKLMAIVEDHLNDSDFTIEDFQKEIGMSRMQLHRKLKALTGHSASEFMRMQRLLRASEILMKGGGNVSEVCYETGFTSLSYFSKCFKEQFGVSPTEFVSRQSH